MENNNNNIIMSNYSSKRGALENALNNQQMESNQEVRQTLIKEVQYVLKNPEGTIRDINDIEYRITELQEVVDRLNKKHPDLDLSNIISSVEEYATAMSDVIQHFKEYDDIATKLGNDIKNIDLSSFKLSGDGQQSLKELVELMPKVAEGARELAQTTDAIDFDKKAKEWGNTFEEMGSHITAICNELKIPIEDFINKFKSDSIRQFFDTFTNIANEAGQVIHNINEGASEISESFEDLDDRGQQVARTFAETGAILTNVNDIFKDTRKSARDYSEALKGIPSSVRVTAETDNAKFEQFIKELESKEISITLSDTLLDKAPIERLANQIIGVLKDNVANIDKHINLPQYDIGKIVNKGQLDKFNESYTANYQSQKKVVANTLGSVDSLYSLVGELPEQNQQIYIDLLDKFKDSLKEVSSNLDNVYAETKVQINEKQALFSVTKGVDTADLQKAVVGNNASKQRLVNTIETQKQKLDNGELKGSAKREARRYKGDTEGIREDINNSDKIFAIIQQMVAGLNNANSEDEVKEGIRELSQYINKLIPTTEEYKQIQNKANENKTGEVIHDAEVDEAKSQIVLIEQLISLASKIAGNTQGTNLSIEELNDTVEKGEAIRQISNANNDKTSLNEVTNKVTGLTNSIDKLILAIPVLGATYNLLKDPTKVYGNIGISGMSREGLYSAETKYYKQKQDEAYEIARTGIRYGLGSSPELQQYLVQDKANELFRMSNGMIDYGTLSGNYNAVSKQLMPSTQGEAVKLTEYATLMDNVGELDFNTSMTALKTLYVDLGMSADKAIVSIDNMATRAKLSKVPIDTYISQVETLAKGYRNAGLDGEDAISVMDNLMSNGFDFANAGEFAGQYKTAIEKFASSPSDVVLGGILQGQSDPFQMLWNSQNTEDPNWEGNMASGIQSMLDLQTSLFGNGALGKYRVSQQMQELGFSRNQAAKYIRASESNDQLTMQSLLEEVKERGSAEDIQADLAEKTTQLATNVGTTNQILAQLNDTAFNNTSNVETLTNSVLPYVSNNISDLNRLIAEDIALQTSKLGLGGLGGITQGNLYETSRLGGITKTALGVVSVAAAGKGVSSVAKKILPTVGGKAATKALAKSGDDIVEGVGKTAKGLSKLGTGGKIAAAATVLTGLVVGGTVGYNSLTKNAQDNSTPTSQGVILGNGNNDFAQQYLANNNSNYLPVANSGQMPTNGYSAFGTGINGLTPSLGFTQSQENINSTTNGTLNNAGSSTENTTENTNNNESGTKNATDNTNSNITGNATANQKAVNTAFTGLSGRDVSAGEILGDTGVSLGINVAGDMIAKTALKTNPIAGGVGDAVATIYDGAKDYNEKQKIGAVAGDGMSALAQTGLKSGSALAIGAGSIAGSAAAGAAIGSVVPVLGTAVGALGGTVVGVIGTMISNGLIDKAFEEGNQNRDFVRDLRYQGTGNVLSQKFQNAGFNQEQASIMADGLTKFSKELGVKDNETLNAFATYYAEAIGNGLTPEEAVQEFKDKQDEIVLAIKDTWSQNNIDTDALNNAINTEGTSEGNSTSTILSQGEKVDTATINSVIDMLTTTDLSKAIQSSNYNNFEDGKWADLSVNTADTIRGYIGADGNVDVKKLKTDYENNEQVRQAVNDIQSNALKDSKLIGQDRTKQISTSYDEGVLELDNILDTKEQQNYKNIAKNDYGAILTEQLKNSMTEEDINNAARSMGVDTSTLRNALNGGNLLNSLSNDEITKLASAYTRVDDTGYVYKKDGVDEEQYYLTQNLKNLAIYDGKEYDVEKTQDEVRKIIESDVRKSDINKINGFRHPILWGKQLLNNGLTEEAEAEVNRQMNKIADRAKGANPIEQMTQEQLQQLLSTNEFQDIMEKIGGDETTAIEQVETAINNMATRGIPITNLDGSLNNGALGNLNNYTNTNTAVLGKNFGELLTAMNSKQEDLLKNEQSLAKVGSRGETLKENDANWILDMAVGDVMKVSGLKKGIAGPLLDGEERGKKDLTTYVIKADNSNYAIRTYYGDEKDNNYKDWYTTSEEEIKKLFNTYDTDSNARFSRYDNIATQLSEIATNTEKSADEDEKGNGLLDDIKGNTTPDTGSGYLGVGQLLMTASALGNSSYLNGQSLSTTNYQSLTNNIEPHGGISSPYDPMALSVAQAERRTSDYYRTNIETAKTVGKPLSQANANIKIYGESDIVKAAAKGAAQELYAQTGLKAYTEYVSEGYY